MNNSKDQNNILNEELEEKIKDLEILKDAKRELEKYKRDYDHSQVINKDLSEREKDLMNDLKNKTEERDELVLNYEDVKTQNSEMARSLALIEEQ